LLQQLNRRKMEDQRRQAAEKRATARRANDAQVLVRQATRMSTLFSPTIGAAVTAGYWFLWPRCSACRTTNAIDLRTLDRRHDAAVTSLIPALCWIMPAYSCACRERGRFAGLCQRIHKERLDRFALVGAVAAVVGIEIATSFKLVESTLRHLYRPQKEAALVALAVPSSRRANLFLPIHHAGSRRCNRLQFLSSTG
jgi:hypothetical protein